MAEAGTNPYLALLQQQDTGPTWAQVLQNIGNLGFGLAGGFSQAATSGLPTMAGVGPGLMMGNQMNVQAANAAEQDRLKRFTLAMQAQHYGAEDEKLREETAQRKREADITEKLMQGLPGMLGGTGSTTPGSTTPGFQATPPTRLMGPTTTGTPQPGSYDARVAAGEGGSRNGGMVFNELGSGAFGPYQFMPSTWAAVRAQNPSLNLPEDMTQATREQHDAAHGAFKAGNAQGLQAAGFQPTPDNLYLAHRFGLGGATSVLRADPDKPLAEVLPIDWQRQNPDMRGQTAGSFRRLAGERVGGSSVPYVVQPNAKPTPYSTMPAAVPFDLGSAGTTLPRPSTAEPSVTAPVMPQPQWQSPGDVMPVNPSAWFPQQPPPAIPAVPSGPPPMPNGGPAPGQPPPAPGTPTPGGPNVIQPQYQPQPGQPSMVVQPPRIDPLKVVPLLQSKTLAPIGQALIGIGNTETQRYLADLTRQQAEEHFRQTQGLAVRQAKVNPDGTINQSVVDAETAAKKAQLGLERTDAIDRTTGQVVSIPKSEEGNPQYTPLKANEEARAAAAAKLAQDNAARAAANQDVIIDPATGQPVINRAAVEAKKEISAAQGSDQTSKINEKLAADVIARNSDWQKEAVAAGGTIRNMDVFNKLSEDVKTGRFAGAMTEFKAKLKGAGINLEAWGIPDGVGPAQAMQMMSQRFALEMRREMPGPMSDGDRKFMERGAISVENDPGANKIMSAWLKGNAERSQDRAKFAREYLNSDDFVRRPAGIDDYVEKKLSAKDYFDHSVLPKEAAAASTQGGPAGAQPPAAGSLPTPKTKAEYDAMPSGTVYMHPTAGQKVKP